MQEIRFRTKKGSKWFQTVWENYNMIKINCLFLSTTIKSTLRFLRYFAIVLKTSRHFVEI